MPGPEDIVEVDADDAVEVLAVLGVRLLPKQLVDYREAVQLLGELRYE